MERPHAPPTLRIHAGRAGGSLRPGESGNQVRLDQLAARARHSNAEGEPPRPYGRTRRARRGFVHTEGEAGVRRRPQSERKGAPAAVVGPSLSQTRCSRRRMLRPAHAEQGACGPTSSSPRPLPPMTSLQCSHFKSCRLTTRYQLCCVARGSLTRSERESS